MTPRARGPVATIALALLLAAGGTARADGDADRVIAKAHFTAGQEYFRTGRYHEAVGEFLEAYRLSSQPDLLYNIGVCYEGLADPGRATAYYTRYLAARPHAPERTEIEAALYRMSKQVATLTVRTRTDGAEVLVDGLLVGPAPVEPATLTAGRHRVEVRRAGWAPGEVTVVLRAGQSATVDVEPRPAGLAPAASPPDAAPLVPSRSESAAPSLSPSPSHRGLWIGLGVGAVAVVGAAILVGVLASHGTDFAAQGRADCASTPSCTLITGFAVER